MEKFTFLPLQQVLHVCSMCVIMYKNCAIVCESLEEENNIAYLLWCYQVHFYCTV
jgi:hypothetical protein